MDKNVDNVSRRGLNIVHLNVASMLGLNKLETLKLHLANSSVDVFCASETWLNEGIPLDQVAVGDFNLVRYDRLWKDDNLASTKAKKGGGLICYIRKGLDYNSDRYEHLNCSGKDLEMQWVSLENKNMRRIVMINVYRPPQGDYKNACKKIHSALTDADLKDNVEIFLLGDFNINLNDRKSIMTKELEFTTSLWNLKACIKSSTRFGVVEGKLFESRIDNIFTNSDYIIDTRTLDWNLSDHVAVSVTRKRLPSKVDKISFTGRSYKNYNKTQFQTGLLAEDWDGFYNTQDPSDCWEIMENRIRSHISRTCPLKTFRVREVREPWLTNELLEEIKDKDRAIRTAKRSKKPEDFLEAKAIRNRVGRQVCGAKAEFLKDQQDELKGDPKKFWRLVKSIVPGKKVSTGKITLVGEEERGVEIKEREVADTINNFFTAIGPNLADKISKTYQGGWKFMGREVEENCPDFRATFQQVLRICKDINTSKSSGIKDVATKICKDAFLVLIPQLLHIFNLSFETGIFPDTWKKATIIPLFKGGKKTEVGNYRPISLLPLPGKIIEKVVHANLSKFLNERSILTNTQGGFRKGFSTASTIADLTDDLFTGINQGLTSLAVFIDLKKAFDTVDHKILVKKLELYGVRGNNLKWCRDYLYLRMQTTLANNVLSSCSTIKCGVPQGSVLGPLFFILYINDMQHAIKNSKVQLYADDTVLYIQGDTAEDATEALQPDLNSFTKWYNSNKLSLNVSKTKLMIVGTRQKVKKAKNTQLYMDNQLLQIVPTYKYLGFILDSVLSFNGHVNNVINTVLYKINLLAKVRKYLTNDSALKIYKSMVLPYFDYGDVVYGTASRDRLDKLQRLQNKGLKICMNYNLRHNTEDLHRDAKCPKLEARRSAHLNNFMYNRSVKTELMDVRPIRTRAHDAPLFKVAVPKNETYKRSVMFLGATKWNSLPADTRNIKNLAAFKDKQRRIMLNTVT